MLSLELSSIASEIPNDAYTTIGRNLVGCSTLRQEYLPEGNIEHCHCHKAETDGQTQERSDKSYL